MNLDTTIVQSKTARELIDFIDELIDIIDDKEHFTINTKNKYDKIKKEQRVALGIDKARRNHY